MKTALALIAAASAEQPAFALCFSGGSDSNVLMDLVFRETDLRPPVVFSDSGLEYPGTLGYIRERCETYGATLHVARGERTPQEQWAKQGWPFWGKLAARQFMQKHRELGVKCDVSSCCLALKIGPGHRKTIELDCTMQMTGQRGNNDDQLRGLRAIKDGYLSYVKKDALWICNPLTGWTETMIRRYIRSRGLPLHPMKAAGAVTIGCVPCGGGAQFTNSGWRIMRSTWPEMWHEFFVTKGAGYAALAAKYRAPYHEVVAAVQSIGGLARLAKERPWVFDYLEVPPRRGYIR